MLLPVKATHVFLITADLLLKVNASHVFRNPGRGIRIRITYGESRFNLLVVLLLVLVLVSLE